MREVEGGIVFVRFLKYKLPDAFVGLESSFTGLCNVARGELGSNA